MSFRFSAAALVLAVSLAAASQGWAMTVKAAIADPRRPADQVARDALRKPEQMLAFAGVKPG